MGNTCISDEKTQQKSHVRLIVNSVTISKQGWCNQDAELSPLLFIIASWNPYQES